MQQFRIFFGLLVDGFERLDKLIDVLFGFRFRRLDHQSTVNHQWEVNRGRVETIIDQAFGDVQGCDFILFVPGIGKHAFVHAGPIIGKVKNVLQTFLDVIGVQHRALARFLQFGAHGQNIGVGS